MAPIDGVTQAMQVLRRQMAENLERMRRSGTLAGVSASTTGSPAPRARRTLRQDVAQRIKGIEADDPRHLEKAALLFVESVLLAEFGEELVNDPEFRDLAVQVQSAILADAALREDMSRLVAQTRRS